jgi:hypothetical protein
MSDTKHTPTPWGESNYPGDIVDSDGELLATAYSMDDGICAGANAAFIVRAVNSHEQLVAALNKIHNWLVCAPIATPEDMAQSFAEMERAASIALAAAEA